MAFMEEKAANNAPRNGSHKAQIFGNLLRDFLEARGTSCSDFGFVHNKKRVTMDIYKCAFKFCDVWRINICTCTFKLFDI